MKQYYFIEKNGTKLGPYKLNELKQQTIYFNELIWRSDSDQWKKASDFEELKDIFIIKPPLTPLEENKKDFNNKFFRSRLPIIIVIYILASTLLSIISFSIASDGWEKQKIYPITNNDHTNINSIDENKNKLKANQEQILSDKNKTRLLQQKQFQLKQKLDNGTSTKEENNTYYGLSVDLMNLELEIIKLENQNQILEYGWLNDIYEKQTNIKHYNIPHNVIVLENIYGLQQSFLFRSYYAFYSKIYLTMSEQDNLGLLFLHIALSAFISLSFFFIAFGIIYYAIKRNHLADKRAKMENIN